MLILGKIFVHVNFIIIILFMYYCKALYYYFGGILKFRFQIPIKI